MIKTPPKETTGGYLAKGQQSHVKLSRHIEHCRTLRYKQMASCVVKLALNNGVRFVALEDLQSYKTSIKQERHENRRLGQWAMGKTKDFLEVLNKPHGLHLMFRNAAFTSQRCCRCGAFGVRYNEKIEPDKQSPDTLWRKKPTVQAGGDWFVCSNPQCTGITHKQREKHAEPRYRLQADMNAAYNIGYRAWSKFALAPFSTQKGTMGGYWGQRPTDATERKTVEKETAEALQKWLEKHYANVPPQPKKQAKPLKAEEA